MLWNKVKWRTLEGQNRSKCCTSVSLRHIKGTGQTCLPHRPKTCSTSRTPRFSEGCAQLPQPSPLHTQAQPFSLPGPNCRKSSSSMPLIKVLTSLAANIPTDPEWAFKQECAQQVTFLLKFSSYPQPPQEGIANSTLGKVSPSYCLQQTSLDSSPTPHVTIHSDSSDIHTLFLLCLYASSFSWDNSQPTPQQTICPAPFIHPLKAAQVEGINSWEPSLTKPPAWLGPPALHARGPHAHLNCVLLFSSPIKATSWKSAGFVHFCIPVRAQNTQ